MSFLWPMVLWLAPVVAILAALDHAAQAFAALVAQAKDSLAYLKDGNPNEFEAAVA